MTTVVAVAYFVIWAVISWLSSPSLDSYGDMVENYAWSQTLALGTFKHPPLFAWIVGAWFALFPTRVWAYYLLSYVNAAVGIAGIVCLARLWVPEAMPAARRRLFLTTVAVFAALSFPYSNLAAKFNADTVLLSLWPWTAYACFAALHAESPWRRSGFAVLFGVMAAAAMMGKYFSVLLLVTLFAVTVSHADYRRWYRTRYPYLTAAIFALALLPHLLWEMRMDFPFRLYLESKTDPAIDPGRIVLFLLSGVYYLALSWLAWLIARSRFRTIDVRPVAWARPLHGLAVLSFLPSLLTVSSNLVARVHLTTHWAIPVWFGLPILMAVWLLPHIDEQRQNEKLVRGMAVFCAALLVGGVVYTLVLSMSGNQKYTLGRREMVRTIEARFSSRFPSQRLSWAGGTWPESGAVAFFAANHPRALPGFPDERRALANPFPEWPDTYGVILCFASGVYAQEGSHDDQCEHDARKWLGAHELPVAEETLTYRAEGWQYIRARPKNVTVFWIQPRASRGQSGFPAGGGARERGRT
jgi:4-amino-4-deoxy-L-arabinose transferase-like glycosyltransferase